MFGRRRTVQSWMMAVAALALAVQVLVPAGLMLSQQTDAAVRLVICTGHGPLLTTVDLGKSKAPAPKDRAGAPCAFANHGVTPTPTLSAPAVQIAWTATAIILPTPADQVTVGRGLAAPPPARGPPTLLA